MAEYTRPATWDDLRVLARYLNAANARYAIIGGYAIAAHGYNRFSEDLDCSPERQRREASPKERPRETTPIGTAQTDLSSEGVSAAKAQAFASCKPKDIVARHPTP